MKNETIGEAAENYGWRIKRNTFSDAVKANELAESSKQDFIKGANWQAERMYTEQDIHNILDSYSDWKYNGKVEETYERWFKQFKKKQNEI